LLGWGARRRGRWWRGDSRAAISLAIPAVPARGQLADNLEHFSDCRRVSNTWYNRARPDKPIDPGLLRQRLLRRRLLLRRPTAWSRLKPD
jgi:hypothetical protein